MEHQNNFNLIRLIAALQVAFMHGIGHLKIENTVMLNIASFLKYIPGVPIFFGISGFLVYQSWAKVKPDFWIYCKKRALRIFPALVPAAIISALLLLFFSDSFHNVIREKHFWIWFLGQLTFFQFYTPDFLRFWGVGTPNGSLWTVSVELQFYLLLPLIASLRIFKNKIWIIWLLVAFLSIMGNALLRPIYYQDQFIGKLSGVSIVPYLYIFVLGVIASIYWEVLKKYFADRFLIWITLFAMICSLEYFFFSDLQIISYWYFSPAKIVFDVVLASVIFSFAFSHIRFFSPLRSAVDVSYGIYIYHMLIINVLISLQSTSEVRFLILYLVLTIAIAYLSWTFVENPALKYKNSIKKTLV